MQWLDEIQIEHGPGHSSRRVIKEIFTQMTAWRAKGERCTLGFLGVPPWRMMHEARRISGDVIDLDMPRGDVSKAEAEVFLPRIFCATLRTALANALNLPIDWMILATGYDKCDGGRFVAEIIRHEAKVPILCVGNAETKPLPTTISDSHLPLREKVNRIIEFVSGVTFGDDCTPEEKSKCGYWGVPPHDQDVLDLFPDETRVLGWTRTMEAQVPAAIDLELWVPDALPTVFYAQAFCQKNGIAKYLAEKYNGLYIEVDHQLSSSTKAKVEAFLKFRVK
jgi:hypothetical protein